ncbi:unnamed protein product [Cyclocybe aegerita]|uniref:Uncharacterized protein n=1 Tax=Cyclocybe aegerita TaxID=1973307 RepID=A0A8S0XN99_CYCAE|nr:unnamed protein product [Cyclocybe aegerita]
MAPTFDGISDRTAGHRASCGATKLENVRAPDFRQQPPEDTESCNATKLEETAVCRFSANRCHVWATTQQECLGTYRGIHGQKRLVEGMLLEDEAWSSGWRFVAR